MFPAQSKVIKTRERWFAHAWAQRCLSSLPPPSPPCCSENEYAVFEARTEFQVGNPGREQTIPPLKWKNPDIWSMPLRITHWKIKLCYAELIEKRGNFYSFKPKIHISVTTVPERIS